MAHKIIAIGAPMILHKILGHIANRVFASSLPCTNKKRSEGLVHETKYAVCASD